MMKWLAALLVFSLGCQLAPTRVKENYRPEYGDLVSKTSKPIIITENTVLLDTRSSFDFGLSHVEGSRSFSWDALAESRESGLLLTDLRTVGLRLSLNGLDINTPILILGNGRGGDGSEGRLAWSLLYYGFYDVQVASISQFRKLMSNRPVDPAKNVAFRTVTPNSNLEILKSEFVPLWKDLASALKQKIFILDVRSQAEHADHLEVPNIEWREFFGNDGRPTPKVIDRLASLGITPKDRVILVSRNGVESGAAAFALIALGFANVQNFTAGWQSLKSITY